MRHWISDKENQREWNQRFKKIRKAHYEGSDSVISAILTNEQRSEVATQIRMYIDPDVTLFFNEKKKADGIKKKNRIETAIASLGAAREISRERGMVISAFELGLLPDKFSHALQPWKPAFGTIRRAGIETSQCFACSKGFSSQSCNIP